MFFVSIYWMGGEKYVGGVQYRDKYTAIQTDSTLIVYG